MSDLSRLGVAVAGAVYDCRDGAPGGVLYAGLMGQGVTLSQFHSIMAALIKVGLVEQRGQCYYSTAKAAAVFGPATEAGVRHA